MDNLETTKTANGIPPELAAHPSEGAKVNSARPTVVSQEDRLRAENIQLKMEKLNIEMQLLNEQVKQKVQVRTTINAEMEKCISFFQEKYGVDLRQVSIDDNGNISQAPQQMPGMQGVPMPPNMRRAGTPPRS